MLTISTFSLILLKSVSRAMNTDYFKTQLVVTVAGPVSYTHLTLPTTPYV